MPAVAHVEEQARSDFQIDKFCYKSQKRWYPEEILFVSCRFAAPEKTIWLIPKSFSLSDNSYNFGVHWVLILILS